MAASTTFDRVPVPLPAQPPSPFDHDEKAYNPQALLLEVDEVSATATSTPGSSSLASTDVVDIMPNYIDTRTKHTSKLHDDGQSSYPQPAPTGSVWRIEFKSVHNHLERWASSSSSSSPKSSSSTVSPSGSQNQAPVLNHADNIPASASAAHSSSTSTVAPVSSFQNANAPLIIIPDSSESPPHAIALSPASSPSLPTTTAATTAARRGATSSGDILRGMGKLGDFDLQRQHSDSSHGSASTSTSASESTSDSHNDDGDDTWSGTPHSNSTRAHDLGLGVALPVAKSDSNASFSESIPSTSSVSTPQPYSQSHSHSTLHSTPNSTSPSTSTGTSPLIPLPLQQEPLATYKTPVTATNIATVSTTSSTKRPVFLAHAENLRQPYHLNLSSTSLSLSLSSSHKLPLVQGVPDTNVSGSGSIGMSTGGSMGRGERRKSFGWPLSNSMALSSSGIQGEGATTLDVSSGTGHSPRGASDSDRDRNRDRRSMSFSDLTLFDETNRVMPVRRRKLSRMRRTGST